MVRRGKRHSCKRQFLPVFVVSSTPSPAGLYLRIHFTQQTQESRRGGVSDSFFRCFSLVLAFHHFPQDVVNLAFISFSLSF
ncbi:MAG: hypothetical protein EWV75_10460 [Microcystis wesenbergii Mw_QC_S_20081001_S30D]|uniref:Uncharacterized protein n=1 Tax=Microcystis wesenbergii Mw_QC_S_20081001_S30D TaxID=2486245 RepID=A0A552JLX1_9CHRO|nr:MAG: hypothetical protein EWV73_21255 [Microcystis wesenbergii Mw_QC_B_20070930_S4D]TRU96782.1 MAG: hypothetical protein EWV75_10460 [Microcystis wesenbergii Mw_QC_S_20081001_S30D]TRU98759.1 MAG: hypothetical protein EWV74_15420 [Microcystis wesenbergii Mw_QC_S_20081001_S30]TRV08656.1 MAG: hypothetical protein EWV89_20295 [Microcystis wesenbergii Mw_QC_B_20070930_S4]